MITVSIWSENIMNSRFIIKYCGVLDSVFVIDSLGRMPLTEIHSELSVHGLDCDSRERAEPVQAYYESICGYQRPLVQEVESFYIKSGHWLNNTDYGIHHDLYDNNGKHVIGSFDYDSVVEFKEWLESELA